MAPNTTTPRTPKRPSNIKTPPCSSTSAKTPPKRLSSWSPGTPSSPESKSPRNPANAYWTQEMQRRAFLHHLKQWSLSHDGCPYYHGTITVCDSFKFTDGCQLGKSVSCVLTDTVWGECQKRIVVRLFPPRQAGAKYRLVVRTGAGWVTAAKYFSQEYFHLRSFQHHKTKTPASAVYVSMQGFHVTRSSEPHRPIPQDKKTVVIRPLFHPFVRLPLEIKQMIFALAIGKTRLYEPARSRFYDYMRSRGRPLAVQHSLPLGTIFTISKDLNRHLVPWLYRTTDFYFRTEGFTNFLWQSGPTNRAYINKLTLAFGHSRFHIPAILHCIKWLAPDPVFALFNPPLPTNPIALGHMWRCQLQDLVKELHLSVLTIDIDGIPTEDIPLVVRILRLCFGSVAAVRITSSGVDVGAEDERLDGLKKPQTWAQLCKAAFMAYKDDRWFSDTKLGSVEALYWEMKSHGEFFDSGGDVDVVKSPRGF